MSNEKKKGRNLRQLILAAATAARREKRLELSRLHEELEGSEPERALVKLLDMSIERVEREYSALTRALGEIVYRVERVQEALSHGNFLNERGEFQRQPDREVVAFEGAMRVAVETLKMVEKALGSELL